ncbi:MAG: HlyD family efflux transporter periplasmic adaptor subunit [Methyloprofundus sp.]|nr:HlyD family efflux transporter periplasmic adaptor subunit [Methyloprofundus sp.]
MEILVSIAYFSLVWLVFFRFKYIRFNLFWKFIVFGLYIMAGLTEVIMLGQNTPYSKELTVERYVIPLAPMWGGLVKEVHVLPNTPLHKGDPIFSMDSEPWLDKLKTAEGEQSQAAAEKKSVKASLAEANRRLYDAKKLVPRKLMAAQELDIRTDRVNGIKARIKAIDAKIASLQAEAEKARYNVDHAIVTAPYDGYVVDLQLRAGAFIRLKTPVVAFVSTESLYLMAQVDQRAVQWIRPGDKADYALSMYPGEMFQAEVVDVIWATAGAQLSPTALLPKEGEVETGEIFYIKLRPLNDDPQHLLNFGASGMVAIYTDQAADVFILLRKLELQSESFLNYLYNPF